MAKLLLQDAPPGVLNSRRMLSAAPILVSGDAGLRRPAPQRAGPSRASRSDGTKAVCSVLLLGGWRALSGRRGQAARGPAGGSWRAAAVACQATTEVAEAGNFVEDIVVTDIEKGTYSGRVQTRFPPEPNGYLHIGHVKSICLNFGIAQKFDGKCNLRFDDTNPESEKQEFIDSIQEDVRWMGFAWDGTERYASDYFPQLYSWAEAFIEQGWAYVDELSAEEISEYRGSVTRPGKDSPYRDRPKEESLEIFRRMRAGELEQGSAVLRAKIDMAHPNVILRDPIMYRILPKTPHPRTGSEWPIYPSYDWAHGLSDAIEGVTHSVCTLEFNMHNELYDWFNEKVQSLPEALPLCQPPSSALPRQHEFARLEMTHIVVSKRKLKRLVEGGYVDGWDDPRMPTISGMRRRGYPPAALRKLCELIGVTKVPTSVIEYSLLENCVRDVLQEQVSAKLLCVLRPLRVTITNWPEDKEDELIEVPGDVEGQPRTMHFGRDVLLDMEDFQAVPEPGFKRLVPGGKVKLRYGYVITCDEVIHGPNGEVEELRCSYDPESLGKRPPKKVAVVHWAHATLSTPVTVRMYDKLFSEPRPEEAGDYLDALNPKSCEVLAGARCEPSVAGMLERHKESGDEVFRVQFERCGFFALDTKASEDIVFNCTVAQRSDFGKPKQVRGKASKKKATS